MKDVKRKVKKNIQKWINELTADKSGFSPMHFACFNGDCAVIKLLHKYGADLDIKNK